MNRLKIGIIGIGSISDCHINAYIKNTDVELYALCDVNKERAMQAAVKYNIPFERVFSDMAEMLKLSEMDAVSICTWNSAHASCTMAALNAGKHVLCEKPMAINAEEAKEMKLAAEKSGKLLMIGFVRRFGNDCRILKDFIDGGYLGNIYYSKATYLRRNGNPGGWFGDKSRSGGGPLIDLGVHVIDLTRYLMGNPKPVSVYGATFQKLLNRKNLKTGTQYSSAEKSQEDICDVEDLAAAMIRFDNGAILNIEASFSLNIKKDCGTIELFGTKSGARLDPELEIYSELNDYMVNIGLSNETALSFEGLFENEINHFVSCIKDGIQCISTAQDGIDIMRILDAIYESAKTGHEVILE
ncbi:MAG: oxidoreductase [Eubacterium sp.]|nr:oxidoreductase [Eubacterium sp.]